MLRTVCFVSLLTPALAAQALPTGEAVMERFVQATGGKAAMDAKRSMVVKGTMEMTAMGLKGAVTIHKAAPNLSLTEVELPGIGRFRGRVVHPQAWPQDLDHAGQRIVVNLSISSARVRSSSSRPIRRSESAALVSPSPERLDGAPVGRAGVAGGGRRRRARTRTRTRTQPWP